VLASCLLRGSVSGFIGSFKALNSLAPAYLKELLHFSTPQMFKDLNTKTEQLIPFLCLPLICGTTAQSLDSSDASARPMGWGQESESEDRTHSKAM